MNADKPYGRDMRPTKTNETPQPKTPTKTQLKRAKCRKRIEALLEEQEFNKLWKSDL